MPSMNYMFINYSLILHNVWYFRMLIKLKIKQQDEQIKIIKNSPKVVFRPTIEIICP